MMRATEALKTALPIMNDMEYSQALNLQPSVAVIQTAIIAEMEGDDSDE